MKKFTKKIVVSVLSALCMLFMVLGCVGVVGIQAKAETAVVNLTFNMLGLNGVENNDNTFGGTKYYTCIRFTTGVFSGDENGAFDFSVMTEKASYVGSGNTDEEWGFAPAYSKWAQGYKNDAVFNFIYVWTANQPTHGDTIAIKAGSYFTISGTFADGTGACDDKYVLSEDINLKFNGTAWETYIPTAESTKVTFTNINSTWNNYSYENTYCTFLHFDGGISGDGGLDADFSDLLAKMTINGSAVDASNVMFMCPNWVGAGGGIVLRFTTNPAAGAVMVLPAGASFTIGGTDTNVYELASSVTLMFDGSVWSVHTAPIATTKVTFTNINSTWNDNTDILGNGIHYTVIHLAGVQTSGYLGQGDDWSEMMANSTINGGESYFNFSSASYIAGPDIASDFIILYSATAPTEGDEFVVKAGATFKVGGQDTNVYELAEDIVLKYKNGTWCVPSPMAEFVEVNYWNNNIYTQAGTRLTLLDFNVEKLGDVEHSINSVTAAAGITINGVKVADIAGASVLYTHGANHMAIDLPTAALYPTAEYPITVMQVAEGTVFENYELPAITLSLIGGTWLVGEYETTPQEEDYITISDLTGETRYELGVEGMISAVDGHEGDVSLKFVYSSSEAIKDYAPFGGLAVYLNSTNLWDGWRIFFIANKVYVYDATMGGVGDEHVLIGEADFGIANNIELQIEITIKEDNGKYSILIGGSCAKLLEINDITPIGDCIGGGVMIYSASRSCIVKDYKFGDIFDPVLTVYSKQEMVLNEGDAVPVIDATAVDGWTEITPTYVWDEGAITDGKMNAGVWTCTITATDANGNYATATVRVTVKGEPKFTVTFDGKDEAEYAYGAKIEKPADPTKASTEKYQYTFDGWYNGETKWDFENDVITADVELTAKFVQSDVYYKVSVTMDGETQVIYVTYGAQVDLSVFDKEGFTKVVKENGEEITSLIVTADVAVEISYTAKDSGKDNGKKKGCGSSIVGGSAVVTMLGVGLVLGKRRKSNEEEV